MARSRRLGSLAICLALVALAFALPVLMEGDWGDDLLAHVGTMLWKRNSMDDTAIGDRRGRIEEINRPILPLACMALAVCWGVRFARGRKRSGDDG